MRFSFRPSDEDLSLGTPVERKPSEGSSLPDTPTVEPLEFIDNKTKPEPKPVTK
jgi:hypothetical protein